MTAVNFVVQSDVVTLFTDGVWTDRDGKILGLGSKVSLLPHLSAAMVVRGSVLHLRKIILALIENAEDFDDLVSRAPGLAATEAAFCDGPHGKDFDLTLLGWSASRGAFEAYRLEWRGQPSPVAWTSVRPGSAISPYNAAVGAALAAQGIAAGVRPPPVEEFGRVVMAAQRATPVETPDGRLVRSVGGFCEMTTITRSTITTEVIQRWPEDRTGRFVGGTSTMPSPPTATPPIDAQPSNTGTV